MIETEEIGRLARELSAKLELLRASGVDECLVQRRTLEEINIEVQACRSCFSSESGAEPLVESAAGSQEQLASIGVGTGTSGLFIVVERPFADEPGAETYAGEEGGLLKDIITKGLKLEPEEVYISFIVKCPDTEGKVEGKEVLASCLPYLLEEIELIRPKVLLCFGAPVAEVLHGPSVKSASPGSAFKNLGGTKVKSTYSLGELIREPSLKRAAWNDIKEVVTELKGR